MTLYLDTSSLVKLYVDEQGSESVRRQVQAATIVTTSAIAYTEARAALARRRRERTLRPKVFASAKSSLDGDWPRYVAIEVTASLCREAGEFAERYRLRALDSLHLAAFANVARAAGVRRTRFSSFDDSLNRAARALARALVAAR